VRRRGALAAQFVAVFTALGLGAAAAAELTVSGTVSTGPDRVPVAGVQVELEVAGRLAPAAADSDAAGRFSARVASPQSRAATLSVTARFRKDGFDPLQAVELCTPGTAQACSLRPAELFPNGGIAALTDDELRVLDPLRSAEGRTLYLLAYQILPPGPSAPRIDPNILAASLQLNIATRMQDLDSDPAVLEFEPLDPVGLVPVPSPVAAGTPEKAKAVGERLNALGVISGTGMAGNSGGTATVSMTSTFVIMPSDEDRSRMLLVHDQDLPAAFLTSAELSQRLSPLWGQSALLAVCRKEFARALAARDRGGMERLRAYLVAERSRTGGDQGMKLADLGRLLHRVDQELRP